MGTAKGAEERRENGKVKRQKCSFLYGAKQVVVMLVRVMRCFFIPNSHVIQRKPDVYFSGLTKDLVLRGIVSIEALVEIASITKGSFTATRNARVSVLDDRGRW